jgi:hypothetical protein
MGFEPAFPASEWPQTHALDRTASGVGIKPLVGYNAADLILVINLSFFKMDLCEAEP